MNRIKTKQKQLQVHKYIFKHASLNINDCEKKICFAILTFALHLSSDQQVSANCAETIAFCEEHLPNDPLIKGVPDDKNPYKGDKGGCTVT